MHPDKLNATVNGVVELAKELDNANLIIDQMAVDIAGIVRENQALREENFALIKQNAELGEITAVHLDYPTLEGVLSELEDLPVIEGELDTPPPPPEEATFVDYELKTDTVPDFFYSVPEEKTQDVTLVQFVGA